MDLRLRRRNRGVRLRVWYARIFVAQRTTLSRFLPCVGRSVSALACLVLTRGQTEISGDCRRARMHGDVAGDGTDPAARQRDSQAGADLESTNVSMAAVVPDTAGHSRAGRR